MLRAKLSAFCFRKSLTLFNETVGPVTDLSTFSLLPSDYAGGNYFRPIDCMQPNSPINPPFMLLL